MTVTLTRALALLALAAGPLLAQPRPEDVPDQPKPAEIAARVKKILDGSPEDTLELPGVAKLVYRRVPLDVHELALKFGGTLTGREQPRGIPLDRYVRQFEVHVQRALEAYLADVGSLTATAALETKGKDIPAGEYRLGIVVENGRPAGLIVSGEGLPKGKPISLKVKKHSTKPATPPEQDKTLRLMLLLPEKQEEGQERFDLVARLLAGDVVSASPLQRAEGASEK